MTSTEDLRGQDIRAKCRKPVRNDSGTTAKSRVMKGKTVLKSLDDLSHEVCELEPDNHSYSTVTNIGADMWVMDPSVNTPTSPIPMR